jgi:hypothetical protein
MRSGSRRGKLKLKIKCSKNEENEWMNEWVSGKKSSAYQVKEKCINVKEAGSWKKKPKTTGMWKLCACLSWMWCVCECGRGYCMLAGKRERKRSWN